MLPNSFLTLLFVRQTRVDLTSIRRYWLIVILTLITACAEHRYSANEIGDRFTPSLSPNTETEFKTLKQSALAQHPDTDFSQLRFFYTGTENYQPTDTTEHEAGLALLNAQEDRDFALCAQFAEAIIVQNFVSLTGHFGAYACYKALEEQEKSDFHRFMVRGIIKSIQNSGDGKTKATAYKVISATEMRDFIRISGLLMFRQEDASEGAHYYERVFSTNPNSQSDDTAIVELYFDLNAVRLHGFSQ